ncbi:Nif11-like leader peptide family natural product precursor [bacterium]|nr:Nif11-like leader peptide family natural product precursor [bacterium]
MTLESAKNFLDDLYAGTVDFDASKIINVSDHDAAMKHIHSLGYDFTPEEMLQASEESNFHGKKITMSGEEAVAGGSPSDWLRGEAVAVSAAGAAACA